MNRLTCREMEWLLREIAVGREEVSPDAVEHLAGCPRCAEKLEQERRLTASLAALAEGMDAAAAPAAVQAMEARLRAAFRENRRKSGESKHAVLRLVAKRPATWAAGIAAVLILTLGVALRKTNLPGTVSEPGTVGANPLSPGTVQIPEPAVEPAERASAANSPAAETVRRSAPVAVKGSTEVEAVPAGGPDTALSASSASLASSARDEQAAPGQPAEYRSEFVPLFYGGDPQLLEAGQVWRVEMPRAALRSVGMPVMEESVAGRVQVDILLGEDGIARAIRFVE